MPRDAISAKRADLPLEMKEPIIKKFNDTDRPIVSLALNSTRLTPADAPVPEGEIVVSRGVTVQELAPLAIVHPDAPPMRTIFPAAIVLSRCRGPRLATPGAIRAATRR